MINDPLGLLILALAALVGAIVALAHLTSLKASIEELKRRLGALEHGGESTTSKPVVTKPAVPPPLPAYATQPKTAAPSAPPPVSASEKPPSTFNWESILGVKLFAWIGGFTFFLGVVFFVKYAFDNNWITPAMRIVAGAIVGIGLVILSLLPRIRRYRIPAQSVCVTGILILYADTYAAHAFYGLIPLTIATGLMWIVTAIGLYLALHLEAQPVAWLSIVGGFAIPFLFRRFYDNPWFVLAYVIVLDCAVAAVAVFKRWTHLILIAAIASAATLWPHVWVPGGDITWYAFLALELWFLSLCMVLTRSNLNDVWTIAAFVVAALVALLTAHPEIDLYGWGPGYWNWHIVKVPIGLAATLAVVSALRNDDRSRKAVAVVTWIALACACFNDLLVWGSNFGEFIIYSACKAALWCVWLFLLFALTPYVYSTKRVWPWIVASTAGPLQFAFAYRFFDYGTGHVLEASRFGSPACASHAWMWLITLAFAIPAAFGVWYLIRREHVALASGDSRLATQGAAVLAFVSLVLPVQFHREWITLGWAIEGLALILLFRWIPNRRLRAFALIVFAGAFVRLALNPAVLRYHPRTHVPIWNWYLYAYGVAAICFFLGARWFGEPKEKRYEQNASAFLYLLCGIVLFLLMNIEIADYFSIGPTLTFSFTGNFARDMTYTIGWSLFAFCLLVLGIARNIRAIRFVGIGLLLVAFAKLFLHDLDSLKQLYRISAFLAVAVIAIVASFVYQRFLLPRTKA